MEKQNFNLEPNPKLSNAEIYGNATLYNNEKFGGNKIYVNMTGRVVTVTAIKDNGTTRTFEVKPQDYATYDEILNIVGNDGKPITAEPIEAMISLNQL